MGFIRKHKYIRVKIEIIHKYVKAQLSTEVITNSSLLIELYAHFDIFKLNCF